MGRRKGSKKNKKEPFNPIEKDLLESYLTYYAIAANKVCFSPPTTSSTSSSSLYAGDDDDDETIRISNCNSSGTNGTTGTNNSNAKALFDKEPTIIAGHEFPILTREVLEKPYLVLPSTLESKQRRTVCDLCIHVGLYHSSIGEKFGTSNTGGNSGSNITNSSASTNTSDVSNSDISNDNSINTTNNTSHSSNSSSSHSNTSHSSNSNNNSNERSKVISIHPDGFDHFSTAEMHIKPLSFPVMDCRPWFYRNDIGGSCPSPTKNREYENGDVNGNTNSNPSSNGDIQVKTSTSTKDQFSFSTQFMSRNKVRESTKHHQEIIQNIINYPNQCLRIGIDNIDDFLIINDNHEDDKKKSKDNNGSNDSNGNNDLSFIDTSEKMKKCAHELNNNKNITELSFDIEAYNASKYKQATCLLQLCTNEQKEYVIDVLSPGVWDYVSLLAPIFANPSIVKIGHGISSIDIPCLHRDFGIFVVNVFDTQEAAKVLGLKGHFGLAKLCKYYKLQNDDESKDYCDLKSQFQTTDWRARPLKEEMIEYGILDVRFLITLRKLLIRDMVKTEEDDDNAKNNAKVYDLGKELKDVKAYSDDSDYDLDKPGQLLNESESWSSSLVNSSADESFTDILTTDIMSSSILEGDEDDDEEEDGYYTADSHTNAQSSDDDYEFHATSESNEKDKMEFGEEANNKDQNQLDKKDPMERLRYNEDLMETFKKSNRQCLSLWTEKHEVAEKNDTLVGLMRRAERLRNDNTGSKKKKIWNRSDMSLYKDLFEWRNDVAKKIGLIPAMMCTLDFLVLIAYTRAITVVELKRLNYFMPEFFQVECNADFVEDMFSIVIAFGKGSDKTNQPNVEIKYYSDRLTTKSRNVSTRGLHITAEDEIEDEAKTTDIIEPKSSSIVTRISTMKITAIVAGIAVFWIGVAKRRR